MSLAAAWYTSGPSQSIAATGSMPCQNRCDGSISAPTLVAPVRSTRRRRVGGLNTRFCGCISIGDLDAVLAWPGHRSRSRTAGRPHPTGSPASRDSRSPRCLRARPATGRRDAPRAGPTSSLPDRRRADRRRGSALRRSSASSGPTSGSGCSGLPLQLSPAIDDAGAVERWRDTPAVRLAPDSRSSHRAGAVSAGSRLR